MLARCIRVSQRIGKGKTEMVRRTRKRKVEALKRIRRKRGKEKKKITVSILNLFIINHLKNLINCNS